MPKDKLLRIIDNKKDRKSFFKSKKGKTKKGLYKPTRYSLFKLKREKIKKSLNKPPKKNLFKSKIKKAKKILYDSKINGNRNQKKFFMTQKIIFLNQKKIIIR